MKNKQIKLGAIISYVAIFVNIAAMLIYTPWMIEQIGEEAYGLYTLANSLIALFLVDFGLSSATSRFVAKYRAEGDQERVNNFLGAVYKLYMVISAVIFIVLLVIYFFIDVIYTKLTPTEIEQFKVVYIISAAFAVINFPFVTFNGILNAYEKFIQLKIADLIYRVLLVGITITVLLLGYGLYALVTVHAVVGLIVIAYKFIVLKICTPVKANYKQAEKGIYKSIFSFSIWVTISSLAQRLVFNITPSVLGIVTNSVAIAVFGIVSTIESYTYTMTSAINGMFMPKIARIYANKEGQQDINPLLLKVGRFQYIINGLIITGFAVVGMRFINLWVGDGFKDAYVGTLLVLIPGLFFNSLQIANTAMVVQNKVKIQSFVNVGTGIVNIIFSFVFSYFFGVIGACLSIFVAYMLRSIAFHIIYKKCLNMDVGAVVKQCYIRLSIPILATIAIGLVVNHFMPIEGWLGFIVIGCITVAVFAVLVLLVGFTWQEKKKMVGFIKKKIIKKAQ